MGRQVKICKAISEERCTKYKMRMYCRCWWCVYKME